MKCEKCGYQLNKWSQICPYCGVEASNHTGQFSVSGMLGSSESTLLRGGLIERIFLMAFIAGALFHLAASFVTIPPIAMTQIHLLIMLSLSFCAYNIRGRRREFISANSFTLDGIFLGISLAACAYMVIAWHGNNAQHNIIPDEMDTLFGIMLIVRANASKNQRQVAKYSVLQNHQQIPSRKLRAS